MATLADSGFPNLVNLAKRLKPDQSIAEVVNVLDRIMPEIDDIPWVESNLLTGHLITQAANGLPSGTWRTLNSGVAATKGDTEQYTETCGMLEDESLVDVGQPGDVAAFRMSEDKLKVEGLSQQLATAAFYESATSNPQRVHGLTARYPATSGYVSSPYVLKPGTNAGTNCRSIWLVSWEPRKIFGLYPKGTMAGLQRQDRGMQRILDSQGRAFYAFATWFSWKCGFAVEDYRYAVRLQWDPDDTTTFGSTAKGLYLGMQQMLNTIHRVLPSTRFYMDRVSKNLLDSQLAANSANFLEYVDAGGQRIPTFLGVPIRVTDSLTEETAIS